jgi:hypothetical protein
MTADGNLSKYGASEVVGYYENLTGLQTCEATLFGRHLKPCMAILEIGVGGGRSRPISQKSQATMLA